METARHKSMSRCHWVENGSPLYLAYHDKEWGVPQHDDRVLFEFLILEGAQAGLSWSTILNKRENYRKAFSQFDARKVAKYDKAKIGQLLLDPGIVRNRLKIEAAVINARAFLEVQKEFGSFDAYIWQFVGGKPRRNAWKSHEQVPASTPRIRCHEQGPEASRFQVRRQHHHVRVHAGHRNGKRPYVQLLPLEAVAGTRGKGDG